MVLLIFAAAGILLLFYLFTRKSEQPVQKVNIQADIQHDEEAEIFLAGGCFWGVQKFLSSLEGVRFTECGYANGTSDNPSYEDVCTKDTDVYKRQAVYRIKKHGSMPCFLNDFLLVVFSFFSEVSSGVSAYRTCLWCCSSFVTVSTDITYPYSSFVFLKYLAVLYVL